jgi:hypothetical protein
MPIALNPRQEFDYVLECDRTLPPEQQTVFRLRSLTVGEQADLEDSLAVRRGEDLGINVGSQKLRILRLGLVGWSNFRDAAGAEVPFEAIKGHPRHVTDVCLDRLDSEWRTELANAITERGRLAPAEKN